MGRPSAARAAALLLRSACRLLDSPAALAAVWGAAVLSSFAVLAQHQQLAEALEVGCGDAGARVGSPQQLDVQVPPPPPAQPRPQQPAAALAALAAGAEPAVQKRVRSALLRVGENILLHPGEVKYTRIWKHNATFKKALGDFQGCEEAMRALGFSDDSEPENWIFPGTAAARQKLESAVAELRRLSDTGDLRSRMVGSAAVR